MTLQIVAGFASAVEEIAYARFSHGGTVCPSQSVKICLGGVSLSGYANDYAVFVMVKESFSSCVWGTLVFDPHLKLQGM